MRFHGLGSYDAATVRFFLMAEYIIVKKSQISLFKIIPFYYQTQTGDYALYKKKAIALMNQDFKKPDIRNYTSVMPTDKRP